MVADSQRPRKGTNLRLGRVDERFKRFSGFHQEQTNYATLAYGHAGKPKVLQYDLSLLVQDGALRTVLNSKGTIFTGEVGDLWASVFTYYAIAVLTSAGSVLCVKDLHTLETDDLETISDYLNRIVPFILGIFISVNLARWWNLREYGVGRVMDSAQNMALITGALFPGPEWHDFHDQVLKYALASVSMIVLTCRGHVDIDSLGRQRDNLLTDQELEVLRGVPYRARPAVMWSWIMATVTKTCHAQQIPMSKQRDMTKQCREARDAVSRIWTYLGTQLPFAYVHLVTLMINLNNMIMAFKCGVVFSVAVAADSYQKAASQMIFLLVVPVLYHALLSISYIIHDPFGEDMLDFPVMAYQEYVNEVAVSIAHFGGKCPALSQKWVTRPEVPAIRICPEDDGDE